MAILVSKLVPLLVTAVLLTCLMLFTTAVGWASGKLIRKVLGIGGK